MGADGEALYARIAETPVTAQADGRCAAFADFVATVRGSAGREGLAELLDNPAVERLLAGVAEGSPYLLGLMVRDPGRLERILRSSPEAQLSHIEMSLAEEMAACEDLDAAMATLRRAKTTCALMIALADLGGVWPVMTVTDALTRIADATLKSAIDFLLRKEARRGKWRCNDLSRPSDGSGYIVLGMGKYGAFELNYSSDIDLIVFFEKRLAAAHLAEGARCSPSSSS